MEESRKNIVGAILVILASNAGNISNALHPKDHRPFPFTSLDGAKLEAGFHSRLNNHILKQQKELELIRQRISKCEYRTTQWSLK